ncbi:MAG: PrsW family intramembrane metalloprotease [Proteobacteria bacterium]|nr:PrsW family intramembrane metalloprotease [Pseudomonadota bacterium]
MGYAAAALHVLIGLLPVLGFLAALFWLDSYGLVAARIVIAVIVAGFAAAGVCYEVNGALIGWTGLDFVTYSRYVGPLVEEFAKGLVVVALVRMNRVGFLVDAAILGFAVGAGFAIVENIAYQRLVPDAGVGLWIVRGFGTAIMHGGCTAMLAVVGIAVLERWPQAGLAAFAPGYLLAVLPHAAYNHSFVSPLVSTLAVMVVVPGMLFIAFDRSERAVANWLGHGFDADTQMLESITSGGFSQSPAGRYLGSLRERFKGPVVADILCYLRLHTELALRAKGLLMMRENGFDPKIDETTRAQFAEMRFLAKSIGPTGRLAIMPLMHQGRKDVWQLGMLESESAAS